MLFIFLSFVLYVQSLNISMKILGGQLSGLNRVLILTCKEPLLLMEHLPFCVVAIQSTYIKKPEVLLGRGTEDVVVDIDLGREGRANKISRRQAIISMDKVGSFHLKNLGKFSISVNNKEVAPGQSLSLNSGCLIEIRGMPFIFETNKTCTKWYLDSVSKEKPNS
ncbi:hypothetical protein Pint_09057 [Pistacia integerrima]|uniref:Uncharacterized protein n=1 Tax=Pistacia integerrima TaxID=434235 RepID=A0ACC0XTL9_9ROSI|nr:hypothetical protein Pint_09057 [Pistacia integerrima]